MGTQVAVLDSEGKASSYVGKVIQGQVKGAGHHVLSYNELGIIRMYSGNSLQAVVGCTL